MRLGLALGLFRSDVFLSQEGIRDEMKTTLRELGAKQ